MEDFRWVAAIIAAHKEGKVHGRLRLQKTVKLLQRKGFPTSYPFRDYFYGPYSDSLQYDVSLLSNLRLVTETRAETREGTEYFVLQASDEAVSPEIEPYRSFV